jgi:hypothetical protein
MSVYRKVRDEFFSLQGADALSEERVNVVELVSQGRSISGDRLPPGMNGVSTYRRADGSLICQEALVGGAANGCARYFDSTGQLVGEDYYLDGGVVETRIFR